MTNAEYTAKKLDIYNQQIAICREYGLTGLLQYTEKRHQDEMRKAIDSGNYAAACDINNKDVREYLPQMTAQAKPKRKPKRNLKLHQKILYALCRLIVK